MHLFAYMLAYMVSIHAPHAGRDAALAADPAAAKFQSTRPMRGATILTIIIK